MERMLPETECSDAARYRLRYFSPDPLQYSGSFHPTRIAFNKADYYSSSTVVTICILIPVELA
jgi:hypothetical protein